MERFENWLTKLEEILVTVASVVMVALVFVQVLCRYVFLIPLQGTEEAARYLMIAATFLGAAVAVKRKSHIKIELRHLFRLGPRAMAAWNLAVDVLGFAAMCLLVWLVYPPVTQSTENSTALDIPMAIPLGAVLVGALLMLIHYGLGILRDAVALRAGRVER